MGNIGKPNSSFHSGSEVSCFLSVDTISLTVFHCGVVLGVFFVVVVFNNYCVLLMIM